MIEVRVQTDPFDVGAELARLDSLLDLAATCPSVDAFRAGLSRQRS